MKIVTKSVLMLTTALLFSSISAQADVKFGVASEPYPPFSAKDASGSWAGWEIEIGNAICAAMNETCVWVEVSWDGIIPALKSKKFDAIMASMSITQKRMKVISFSDKYYNTPAVVVAQKSADINASPESLAGKIIGVQTGTTNNDYAQKYYADTAAVIKPYQTSDERNQDLVSGRNDAVLGDSLALSAFLASDAGQCCEVKGEIADQEIYGPGIGAGIRKEDNELREKFNAAIAKIRADGTYDKISAKYFSFDIYGE